MTSRDRSIDSDADRSTDAGTATGKCNGEDIEYDLLLQPMSIPARAPESRVVDILRQLKINETAVGQYAVKLRNIGVDNVDHLQFLDDVTLSEIEMLPIHRRILLRWVQENTHGTDGQAFLARVSGWGF